MDRVNIYLLRTLRMKNIYALTGVMDDFDSHLIQSVSPQKWYNGRRNKYVKKYVYIECTKRTVCVSDINRKRKII